MRIGADTGIHTSPKIWARAHADRGYGACVFPVKWDAGEEVIEAYRRAAENADLVIAEVGAWSNPLDPDPVKRRNAVMYNIEQLRLADKVGAKCCVNISGSRHPSIWMAPHKDNLTEDTFDMIVKTVREIIDEAKPKRTYYTLETMPWCFPDTLESYARLIDAIDRDAFGVHFDPCNLTYTPRAYFDFEAMVYRAAAMFGRRIKSVHVKDLIFKEQAGNVEITEVLPGAGGLDLSALIEAMEPVGCPLIIEHLNSQQAYAEAFKHVYALAYKAGIAIERARG